jgi:hypothetical protein
VAAIQLLSEKESRAIWCQWECHPGFYRDRIIPNAGEGDTSRHGRHKDQHHSAVVAVVGAGGVDPAAGPGTSQIDMCYPCRSKVGL